MPRVLFLCTGNSCRSHADAHCPVFPGNAKVVHIGFDDPLKLAEDAETEEEALAHYRRVRDEMSVNDMPLHGARFLIVVLAPAMVLCQLVESAAQREPTKPVPSAQAVPMPYGQVSFQRLGTEIARYHFGPSLRRPFVFPVIGPSGRRLTRMGHPRDPESHSHHNSIWIAHHDVGGVDFWGDRGGGRIVHRRVLQFTDEGRTASLSTENAWMDETNHSVLLIERRRLEVRLLDGREWFLTIDSELRSAAGDVTLGKTPFGLIGVRMAKTIGVNDGGGTIRNSEGQTGEKEIFWKPARWVDYSGPVTATAVEGITLMDHPANPNHPSAFHVRADGWMGASLTLSGPRTITAGKPLRLRYGLYVHGGKPSPDAIQRRWKEFAMTKLHGGA